MNVGLARTVAALLWQASGSGSSGSSSSSGSSGSIGSSSRNSGVSSSSSGGSSDGGRISQVFAQWEIADALIHGEGGCGAEAGAGYMAADWYKYPLREAYEYSGRGSSGAAVVDVHKSVPLWPQQCMENRENLQKSAGSGDGSGTGSEGPPQPQKQHTLAEMRDPAVIKQYYLSTNGVMEHFLKLWARQSEVRCGAVCDTQSNIHMVR